MSAIAFQVAIELTTRTAICTACLPGLLRFIATIAIVQAIRPGTSAHSGAVLYNSTGKYRARGVKTSNGVPR